MADLGKVWAAIGYVFFNIVFYIHQISEFSPLELGYVIVAAWVALLFFNHRRNFYLQRHIDIEKDVNPSYGRSAVKFVIGLILKILLYGLFIVGSSILWRNFLPISFEGAFRFLLGHSGAKA